MSLVRKGMAVVYGASCLYGMATGVPTDGFVVAGKSSLVRFAAAHEVGILHRPDQRLLFARLSRLSWRAPGPSPHFRISTILRYHRLMAMIEKWGRAAATASFAGPAESVLPCSLTGEARVMFRAKGFDVPLREYAK